MTTQITTLAALGGKTIKPGGAILYEPDEEEILAMLFTDGTFFRVRPYQVAGADSTNLVIAEAPQTDDERVKLGLITQADYDAAQAAAQAERARANREYVEEKDRAEYARLKAKFEGKPT